MADLITHSLSFTKESLREYFIKPLFVESDIRDLITVRTDLKTGEKLDLISELDKITKGYAKGTSFTASTGVTITQKTVSVVKMKAEVHQNGRAFVNYVKQELLRKGYAENDISGTVFEEIILSIFFRALARDLQRQIFLGDTLKEVIASNAPNGTLDADYKEYNGLWTQLMNAAAAATIPSGQVVDANTSALQTTVAVANVKTATMTGTSGTANVTINGVAYLATFNTDLTTTAADFVSAHAATILARYGKCVVTSSGAGIIVTAGIPGLNTTVAVANVSGNLAGSVANTTPAVQNTTLKAGAGKAILTSLYNSMTPELRAQRLSGALAYMVTSSIYDSYMESLEADGTEQAHMKLIDGVQRLTFRGIPVVERADWDVHIENDFGGVRPHRAILTIPANLIAGTDGQADDMDAEMWYDQNTQENKFRVEYYAGTLFLHEKFVSLAY